MQIDTKEALAAMTPEEALALLKEGNQRFVDGRNVEHQLMQQIVDTSMSQFPFAVVLSCIDSRVPPELIFDQGIGDIFSIRIAGNLVNGDILGSIEYACKVVGSRHILVLGHTRCGAIQGACDDVELGNLTGLVEKLKPAVTETQGLFEDASLDQISEMNVRLNIEKIRKRSPVLKEMMDNKEISISGAMYDVETGEVSFL
jgi:carbonic anhydrase